jgi:hypothetical protein
MEVSGELHAPADMSHWVGRSVGPRASLDIVARSPTTASSRNWQANILLAVSDISGFSWDSKFQFRDHNMPPLLPLLSQMNTVHALIAGIVQSV